MITLMVRHQDGRNPGTKKRPIPVGTRVSIGGRLGAVTGYISGAPLVRFDDDEGGPYAVELGDVVKV